MRQRDEALQQYRQTGIPQSVDLPTADGGIQTVWVGGSRAATSYGTGGMVHTSPMAGFLTELSQTPEGFVGKVKVGKSGQPLPDIEQRHFVTTQGVPAFRVGSAFNKVLYEDPNFSPGYQTFVDPLNLADVEHVRKVFGGDVDTGVMRPSAVVELEGGVPQSKVIAGGPDKLSLHQEYPVGLQKTRGITEHMHVDVPPDMQVGRWEVLRDNVLAEVDRLRGRTETFYVTHQNADGTIEVLRKADMDALAAEGVSLDDALRVRTRAGETRFIARSQWDSAVRRVSPGAARGNDERHNFKNAESRGPDYGDNFGAGLRALDGNRPVDSVDVGGRSDGRYFLGNDAPFRVSAPAPTAWRPEPLPGIAGPTPSRIPTPTVKSQPDPRIPDPRVPNARVPDPRVPDARVPDARVPDPRLPDARVPNPRVPNPRVPDPRIPDPRVPDPQETTNRGGGSSVPRAEEYVPQVVQWRSENQNILDLLTGEHMIVPLSDIHMATFDVVQVGKEKPLPDVAAGALRVTSSGQYAVPQYRSQPSRTRNFTAKQPVRGSRRTGKPHPYLDRRDGVRKRRRR